MTRRAPAVAAVLAGVVGLAGWWLRLPWVLSILPSAPPVAADAALGLILGGMALRLSESPAQLTVWGRRACCAVLLLIAATHLGSTLRGGGAIPTLSLWQAAFGDIDASDQLLAATTSLAFAAAGIAFWPLRQSAPAWQGVAGKLGALAMVAIGSTALMIHVMVGAGLVVSAEHGTTSVLAAIGIALLGLGRLAAPHAAPVADAGSEAEARRIVRAGTGALAVVAVLASVPGFILLQRQNERTLATLLSALVGDRLERLSSNTEQRAVRAAAVARHPDLVARAASTLAAGGATSARDSLAATLGTLRTDGFRRLAVVDAQGQTLAESGERGDPAARYVPLGTGDVPALSWDGTLVLRTRHSIPGRGQAALVAEQSLPQLERTFRHVAPLGPDIRLALCDVSQPDPFCVTPGAPEQAARESTLLRAGAPWMAHATAGASGVEAFDNESGDDTLIAYARHPAGPLSIAMAVDSARFYAPLALRFQIVLLVLAGMVAAGHALFRWRVRPLVERLRAASEHAQAQALAAVENAARHQSVFMEAPNAILVVDRQGTVVDANERASIVFGFDRDALQGRSVEDLVPPASRAMHAELRHGFLKRRRLRAMAPDRPLTATRSDGTAFPVEVLLSPMVGTRSDLVVATVQDISQRVAAESALRSSEHRFRSMMEHAPIGMALVALDGRFLEVNTALCDMLGRDRDTLLLGDFQAITHPDDLAEDLGHVDRLRSGTETTYRMQKRYLHADGGIVWVDLSVSLVRQPDGTPLHFISQVRDITEDLRRQAERDELAAFQNSVLDVAGISIVACGPDGRVRQYSRGAEATFGYPAEDVVGKVTPLLFHDAGEILDAARQHGIPADAVDPGDTRLFERLLSAGWIERQEWTFVARDGRRFPGWLTAARIFDTQGRSLGTLGVVTDVSELRARDRRIVAALREKEVLLKEVYHRVKNNLQVVSSLLWLQARECDDAEARNVLTDSMARVRAMALVHEKLYQSDHLDEIPLHGYVGDLCRHLGETNNVASRGVTLEVRTVPLHAGIETAVPLGLMLNELLSNCLKHAFPDDRRGRIVVSLTSNEDGTARLTVQDDGTGLPAGLDPMQSRSLGLKLVRNLSAQLGGEISLEAGQGLKAALRFPLTPKRYGDAVPPLSPI